MVRRPRTDWRTEKTVETSGDRFMESLGFRTIRFSQPRNTMQTPGIPDRRYYNPMRDCALWWEAKTAVGYASGPQVAFRLLVEAVGEIYLIGTDDVLHEWAIQRGWVERVGPDALRILRRER